MLQSMTGFAAKTISLTKGKDQKAHISIQLKSLNSRYFELNAKLPQPLAHLETDLLKRLKSALYRGYVHVIVNLDNPSIFKGTIEPSIGTAQEYMNAIQAVQAACKIGGTISIDNLIRLPNIFAIPEQDLDTQSSHAILAAMDELIATVIDERKKEGAQLQKDLERLMKSLHVSIEHVAQRSIAHIDEQKQKLIALTKELHDDTSDSAEIKKSTLYTILDKIDIHEEIVRFKSHLENVSALLLNDHIEKGKRLDFTMQELAREINTISAKCSDAVIARLSIDIKVDIEKAREQVQNIV